MTRVAVLVVSAALLIAAHQPAAGSARQLPPLPEALEIELALSAAPKHLRDGATVLRLDAGGYVEVRRGTNGFSCLVARPHPKALAPMCYDVEGTRTIVPRVRDEAALRAQGKLEDEIRTVIEAGFRSGKYRAPERPGVSYMLSPVQATYDPERGVRPFVPHLMFYAPDLTDADVGGMRGGFAFINQPGPHGMIIVPVGERERVAIEQEFAELIERTRRFFGQPTP